MQSGHCKMNGKDLILLDKNISLQEQSEILLQTLKNFDLEDIYVASWIREFIELEEPKILEVNTWHVLFGPALIFLLIVILLLTVALLSKVES